MKLLEIQKVFFFYGGDSEEFVKTLEFIGLSPINREFSAFCFQTLVEKLGHKINSVFMLNLAIYFMIIILQVKTFTVSYFLNKTTRQRTSLKNLQVKTFLKHILALFYKVFQSTTKKSLIFLPLKIQNIFFIVSMTL